MESQAVERTFAAYLDSRDETEANGALGELLVAFAAPLVWTIFHRQLARRGSGFEHADLEDLHASTLLKLQSHLAQVRAGKRAAPSSLPDYVAVSAYNAAASFLMAREPERTRLRDRVRYVLRRDPALASWPAADRELVCGPASRRGAAPGESGEERLDAVVARHLGEHGSGWGQFPRLVAAVLGELAAPCRLEELVDALARCLGVADLPAPSLDQETGESGMPGSLAARAVDPAVGAERALDLRDQLAAVWSEIAALPANQRFALLVNLRGEGGEDLLDVLVGSKVVASEALAASLGLTPEGWADLSEGLPRDDTWIAARLGLTRQQVINLRKAARLRLARRLRHVLPGLG